LDTEDLPAELQERIDPYNSERHVFLEPARAMSFEDYQQALHATRTLWARAIMGKREVTTERTEHLWANAALVERIWYLATATPSAELAPKLRDFVREQLDADYPSEQLYVDLIGVQQEMGGSSEADEEREDALLDVMDFLSGWCAPGARLY
jgi:hypothetical protein